MHLGEESAASKKSAMRKREVKRRELRRRFNNRIVELSRSSEKEYITERARDLVEETRKLNIAIFQWMFGHNDN